MAIVNYHGCNGAIIAESNGTARTDYGADAIGSTIATYDSSASTLATFRFKPNGVLLTKTGAGPDVAFLWTGMSGSRHSSKSYSEQYNRARHYSAGLGVWSSIDPVYWPVKEKAYAYVNGNPTTYVDPTGLQFSIPQPGFGDCGNWMWTLVITCTYRKRFAKEPPPVTKKCCDSDHRCDTCRKVGGRRDWYSATWDGKGSCYDCVDLQFSLSYSVDTHGNQGFLTWFSPMLSEVFGIGNAIISGTFNKTFPVGKGVGYESVCTFKLKADYDVFEKAVGCTNVVVNTCPDHSNDGCPLSPGGGFGGGGGKGW